MNLKIDKRLFLEQILIPTSKLTEHLCLDFTAGQDCEIKTLVSSEDNTTILMAKMPCRVTEGGSCTIPDCKTFLRLFSGIQEDGLIEISIEQNLVRYSSSSFSFKYHLLDEMYSVRRKAVSEEKLNQIVYDTNFTVTKSKFAELIKFNSIIPDAEKLYFVTKEGRVLAKLGDEQKANTNEIVTDTSNKFNGLTIPESMPINIQSLLLMSFNSEEIKVSINHKLKVFCFSTPHMKYVVSGLVK